MERSIALKINGKAASIVITDPERPLLDVLREDLGLTGTKYGCGEGACGACTVLLDGAPVRSCVTAVSRAEDRDVQTIEGLAADGKLHVVQEAFIEKGAMQCGYCVPGQIMTAVALLRKRPAATRDEIIKGMNGNLCRCCNYANILSAVQHAARLAGEGRPL